jgi:seryl-tRNA synthetase
MYLLENGNYRLWGALSKIERKMIDTAIKTLEGSGFTYLSVPSSIKLETVQKQDENLHTYFYEHGVALSGSAEQGILEMFEGKEFDTPMTYFAENTCFRVEPVFEGLKTLREFRKVEQFVFTDENNWSIFFEVCLRNAELILDQFSIRHRRREIFKEEDPGYYKKKVDIEVMTEKYGWMETHSCTYFGTEQSDRFGIGGSCNHTISCTGVAVPRTLIPVIERMVDIEL